MPRKPTNMVGQRYGKLVVLEEATLEQSREAYWSCQCDCGENTVVRGSNLRNGNTKSCGCARAEISRAINTRHGHARDKNMSPEYKSWLSMKDRCFNTGNKKYHRYGNRGITICKEWMNSFEQFYKDMGPRPSPKHSIDRIDNNGNYEPDNCRWATSQQQANNKIHPTRISVRAIFNDGSYKDYESIGIAAKDGFLHPCISNCINGKQKTHRGAKWIVL